MFFMHKINRTWIQDFLLITLIIGFMYSVFINVRPLAPPDEGRYAEIPREMVATGDYTTPHLNGVKYFEKPVLFYWLQSLTIKAFGLHEWSLRLMTSLLGLCGCLLTYYASRTLFNRETGILAALILGSCILYASLANFITLDMAVSFFLSGSLLSFLLGNHYPPGRQRNFYMWSMYSFAAFATLTKGLIGLLFPSLIIFAWLCLTKRWRSVSSYCLLSGTILFLVITLPWHIMIQLKNPEFFHFYFFEQHVLRYLTDYADRAKPKWFFPVTLMAGFFPWTGFMLSAFKKQWQLLKKSEGNSTEIFLLLWAAIIFVFYWFSKSQLLPYILPIFTPLAILTAHHIQLALKNNCSLKFGYSVALIMATTFSIVVFAFMQFRSDGSLGRMNVILILPALLTLGIVYCKRNIKLALCFMVLCSLFLMGFAAHFFEVFDNRSIKPLALKLATIVKPNDLIYDFNHYHQDLPVYLRRNIKLVNYTGELIFGNQQHPPGDIWLHENTLITEWPTQNRKFLIVKTQDLSYLKNNLNLKFFLIDVVKNYALICNQPSPASGRGIKKMIPY
jgi:4-amino-4-deoxy-L-arabinose transferase-like glycosyltransferase